MKKLEQCSEIIITCPKYIEYKDKTYSLNKFFNDDQNSLLYDLLDEPEITEKYIYVEPETLQVLLYKGLHSPELGYAKGHLLTQCQLVFIIEYSLKEIKEIKNY